MSDALAKVVQQLAEACIAAQRRSGMLAQLEEVETARIEWRWLQGYEQDAGRFKVGSLPVVVHVGLDLRHLVASILGAPFTASWLQDYKWDAGCVKAGSSFMAGVAGYGVRQVARSTGRYGAAGPPPFDACQVAHQQDIRPPAECTAANMFGVQSGLTGGWQAIPSVWGGPCAWCRWRPACLLEGRGGSARLHGPDAPCQPCLPCLQGRDANRRLQRSIRASRQRDRLPALLEHVLGLLAEWQVQEGSAFTYDGQMYQVGSTVGWGRHAAPAHSTGQPARRILPCAHGPHNISPQLGPSGLLDC